MADQSSATNKSKPTTISTEKSTDKCTNEVHREVYGEANQDSTETADLPRTYEIDRMFTKADFKWWLRYQDVLTRQCWVQMTTGCKLYSAKLAEALHRAQTARVRMILTCITILERGTCLILTNKTRLMSTIDDRGILQPMLAAEAPIYAKSLEDAAPLWQMPTITYTGTYGLRQWNVVGVWV